MFTAEEEVGGGENGAVDDEYDADVVEGVSEAVG